MRRFVAICLVAVAVAGCSSSVAEPPVVTSSPGSTTVPADDGGTAVVVSGAPSPEVAPASVEYSVAIGVSVESADLDEEIDVTMSATGLDSVDPFTEFISCSGLRTSVGTYAVTAVDDATAIRSISVLSVERVTAPGVYDADVRVELADGDPVTATGTMTLADGLRTGSFNAFEPTGETVTGTFRCDGPGGTPVPIADVAASDGVLRSVEVVALLRRDDAERVLTLTLDTNEVESAAAECPAIAGEDGPVLVRVAGDQALGAINAFELTDEPAMRMRVGGSSYELATLTVDIDAAGTAGTFSGATNHGIAIDGAFRCA